MKRIQIVSNGKRIFSSLIDLILLTGLSCFFYFCAFYPLVSKVGNFNEVNNSINKEKLNSNLYVQSGNNVITILENNKNIKDEEIHIATYNFYTDYMNKRITHDKDVYTPYWYYVYILHLPDEKKIYTDVPSYDESSRLFFWKDRECTMIERKSDKSANDFHNFYILTLGSSLTYLNNTSYMKEYYSTLNWGNIRAILYSTMLGTFIPCFIVPVCIKNGKTIGKLCLHLVVLTDEGYYYKRYKHIFRYLAFYVIEFFGAFLTIGLTLILTFCLVMFSKKKRALHDYIAFSVVADERMSVFFKDEQEEEEYRIKALEQRNLNKKDETLLQKNNP